MTILRGSADLPLPPATAERRERGRHSRRTVRSHSCPPRPGSGTGGEVSAMTGTSLAFDHDAMPDGLRGRAATIQRLIGTLIRRGEPHSDADLARYLARSPASIAATKREAAAFGIEFPA